jgi:hypothetical protein
MRKTLKKGLEMQIEKKVIHEISEADLAKAFTENAEAEHSRIQANLDKV